MASKQHAPGFEGTPEALYSDACFAARQRLLGKGPEARTEIGPHQARLLEGLSPSEARLLVERVQYTVTVLAARENLRASLTPRTFNAAYLVPIITFAAWCMIGWMYLFP
jgi:hypothetical protein